MNAHLQPDVFDHPLKSRMAGGYVISRRMERVPGAFSCSLALAPYRRAAYNRTDPITPSEPIPSYKAICAASSRFRRVSAQNGLLFTPSRAPRRVLTHFIALIRRCTCRRCLRPLRAACVTDWLQRPPGGGPGKIDTAKTLQKWAHIGLLAWEAYVRLHFIKQIFFAQPMPQRDVPIDDSVTSCAAVLTRKTERHADDAAFSFVP